MRAICLFAALLTAGCTTVGHQRVEGWPALRVVEHHVPHAEMRERCVRYVAFGMPPEACAEINLTAGTCEIWYSADFPPQRWIVEHERLHCQGYDHLGSNVLHQLLQGYLATQPAAVGASR